MNNPGLLAVSGSFEGTDFVLNEKETSIGRDQGNDIRIPDRSISRRHCLIKNDGETFTITDFGSFNGTFVNGVAVKEKTLRHGDRVMLGDIRFIFFRHENDREIPTSIEFAGDIIYDSTIRIERKDALYLNSAQFLLSLPPDDQAARNLSTLLDFNIEIGKLRDLDALQNATFNAIFDAIPARRGAILLIEETLENIGAIFTRNKTDETDQPFKISQTIAEQVVREKTAILCRNVAENSDFNRAESLLAAQTDSLLCVPLTCNEKIAGIIYLDTNNAAQSFNEDNLQFLTAVAGIVSVVLENIRHLERLTDENQRLREEINLEHDMIGESAPMQNVFRFIEKVARTDATVLIRGESGTGKELVAHAVHENSERRNQPFIAINCAVLSENLLESELFGHERGAFTTAISQKKGKIEMADSGTLFLDEIGEMSSATQAKLLRVLQEREFERVGGTRTIKVDVRVIAATNRDLETEIKNGNFREDLYYRLNVVALKMPPLRERREDIAPLADFFVTKYSLKCKRKVSGISREARELLRNYDFPGNVRELENAVERAVVLGNSETILPEDLPETILESDSEILPVMKYQKAVNEMKKNLILKTLEQTAGNYTEAAKILELHPANLHRLIRTLDIKKSI